MAVFILPPRSQARFCNRFLPTKRSMKVMVCDESEGLYPVYKFAEAKRAWQSII